jgi:hypothetical protein
MITMQLQVGRDLPFQNAAIFHCLTAQNQGLLFPHGTYLREVAATPVQDNSMMHW